MDTNPIKTAARESERVRKLGGQTVCMLCGEARISALCVQLHHVVGKNHDQFLTGPLCLNCHAAIHEDYRRAGVDMRVQPDFLERLKMILIALGIFLRQLGETCLALAEELAGWLGSRVAEADHA